MRLVRENISRSVSDHRIVGRRSHLNWKTMSAFLIAISWNDPEEVAAYKRVGLDDVPSCSTGIFIHADTVDHALSWGSTVLKKFTEFLFPQKDYALEALELHCWVEVNPEDS